MDNFATQIQLLVESFQKNLSFVLLLIAGLYGIHIVNWMLGFRLNFLGIYPRKLFGMIGIFFSTFLHTNFNHIFFNSIPLFILTDFVLLSGHTVFYIVSAIIILISGLGTWLIGRAGFHVGASGLIMGYWSYLLMNSYREPSVTTIALGIVCIYYFGSLIFHLFPTEVKSSWEAHVTGFLGGIAASYLCPIVLSRMVS